MRKGNLVKFKRDHEEVKRSIELSHVYGHPQPVRTLRPTTAEERIAWREQKYADIKNAAERGEPTYSIAFDDAGESRLAPRSTIVNLPVDGVFIVERARCRVSLDWGNPRGGMAKILYTSTGEITYVSRDMLELV
jgi:hypothetical protein